MSGFHYEAKKLEENNISVKYNLNTDRILHPKEYIQVEIKKEDLSILNFDQIKDLDNFKTSYKPLNWLRAKCTEDKITFKDKLTHTS